ncbi:cilia- and flagella-associated protein 206-like [Diretmus argenteus]
MSQAQAENVIKNIIREIEQECAVKGRAVSETLVAFMVKVVVLDPRNEFNVDRKLTKKDVQKLVELCVDKLLEEWSPALDTIKMQVYFDMNYTSRREFVEEYYRLLQDRLSPVSREITDSRVKTRDEVEGVYRNIISYVLLRSGMGSTTDVTTVRETTAALQSVFPQLELGAFMSLTKTDKEQQLSEMSTIVTGIRLFNKFSKRGGESIDDLPVILSEALPAVTKGLEKDLNVSQRLAWRYTALLERLMDPENPPGEPDSSLLLLNQVLYNVRQHEVLLKVLLADVGSCARHVESLQTELESQMKLLRETVHSKTAVPTAQVFPHFTALAKSWSGLQDELGLLKVLDNVAVNLQPFLAAQSKLFPEAKLDELLEGSEVKTDEQRMVESSDERIDPFEMKTHEWLRPETTANSDELLLQYNGVCAYTLVTKDGLLLPGNPAVGVLKHKERFYVFSSKEAALKFASSADDFIAQVAERAKRFPELIQLLHLHHQFAYVTPPYSEMQSGESLPVKPKVKCDSCTQTDVHPVETNMVKSYEWNEWELRRKAIKLANLRTKVTHSTQSNLSHMRRENATQTFLPKDAACQSKRDGGTNVPTPQVYMAGLRGERAGPVTKINLTTSIDG